MTAVLLACSVFTVSVFSYWQPVKATGLGVPATAAGVAAGETLQFIYSILMGLGITVNLKELVNNRFDPDNWDWREVLDDPASQEDINTLERKLWKEWDEAVEKYQREHPSGSTPTPEPTQAPAGVTTAPAPVTPAPTSIPQDIADKIDSWHEMKKKALQEKVLTLGAVAGACLKEAVSNWWDSVMDDTPPSTDLEGNPLAANVEQLIGKLTSHCDLTEPNGSTKESIEYKFYMYNTVGYSDIGFYHSTAMNSSGNLHSFGLYTGIDKGDSVYYLSSNKYYVSYYGETYNDGKLKSSRFRSSDYISDDLSDIRYSTNCTYTLESYVPYELNGVYHEADTKPLMKPALWVSPNLQKMLDDAEKSPDLPSPVPVTLPSLDEIKDLNKEANNSTDDDRPTIIQNFINNHLAPDTTPDPSPSTTPAVVPNPDGSSSTDTNPTGSPDPDGSTSTDPNPTGSPTEQTPEEAASPYKADLREVFPFCIPFDLIHLLKAFEAEAEAPVFEFPLDLELDNPWTGEKVVDYHHTFKLDMSDYEPVIKILRIFQVVFFIIALMLITRQQMIKG